jgi:hypothetical protein
MGKGVGGSVGTMGLIHGWKRHWLKTKQHVVPLLDVIRKWSILWKQITTTTRMGRPIGTAGLRFGEKTMSRKLPEQLRSLLNDDPRLVNVPTEWSNELVLVQYHISGDYFTWTTPEGSGSHDMPESALHAIKKYL